MNATVSLVVAVVTATAGVAVYVLLYRTFPRRHRLPLIRWLTWQSFLIVVFAVAGRDTVPGLFQALVR